MTDLQEGFLPWINAFATLLGVLLIGIVGCALWKTAAALRYA